MRAVIDEHFGYLADAARLEAYRRALERVVTPDSVVVDLGCGTGVLGWLACRAGARRVYAIDRTGMIEIARALARDNGVAGRIVHIRQSSRDVELPEPADLVVADQMGPLGYDAGITADFADAAARWLAPGGQLIPGVVETFMAPVEAPAVWASVDRWSARPAGLRLDALRAKAANTPWLVPRDNEPRLLGAAGRAMTFDLRHPPLAVQKVSLPWAVTSAGTMHGLLGWFVATLAPGIAVTNGPSQGSRLNRRALLLPLDQAVSVLEGDQIHADLIAGVERSFLAWTISVVRNGTLVHRAQHATLRGELFSTEDLGLHAAVEARA